jgi:hypothetical protein
LLLKYAQQYRNKIYEDTDKWVEQRRQLNQKEKKDKDSREISLDTDYEPKRLNKHRAFSMKTVKSFSNLREAEHRNEVDLAALLKSLPKVSC